MASQNSLARARVVVDDAGLGTLLIPSRRSQLIYAIADAIDEALAGARSTGGGIASAVYSVPAFGAPPPTVAVPEFMSDVRKRQAREQQERWHLRR